MKKIVFKVIDTQVKDCLLYMNDDGLWIINPETKEWVIHVGSPRLDYNPETKEWVIHVGSPRLDYLWYNYWTFKILFNYISLDVFKDRVYIKEWVEDRLNLKIGPNYYSQLVPDGYDWSHEFKPEKVIESGKVIRDFCVPMYLS